MLFARWRISKNKKGITLVEMIAAIAITAILASVLSMMIVPVMNSYRNASTKAELQQAVTGRLNDVALHLRGATGVYVTSNPKSFPETNVSIDQGKGTKYFEAKFGIALFNCYQNSAGGKYLYPELRWNDYDDVTNNKAAQYYAGSYTPSLKLASDDFQTDQFYCPDQYSFYFYVRSNPDGGGHSNVLEVHLLVKKGNVSYEGSKTIVCDNLVIKGEDIYTCQFEWKNNQWTHPNKATVSTGEDASKWKKYYSVWFSRDV